MSLREYGVDLHVHTPASNDYKGYKSEEEYINILKCAKDNNIDLICITDHSTILGYKKIMDIKNQTANLFSTLNRRNNVEPNFLSSVEQECSLFNSIHILMGVELNVSPGIHYIVVFKECVLPEKVEEFLFEITKSDQIKQTGLSELMLDINSKQLFDLVSKEFGEGCFLYAPHCDSNSGIIETLKNCKTERLNILKDERLLCLGFNKDTSRQFIRDSLLPQVKGREKTINFIQDSDYHGGTGEKVGFQHFLIERECGKICYDTLFGRLLTDKYLKTTLDTAVERYEQYKKNDIIFDFGCRSTDDIQDELCMTTCAMLNCNKGKIQFEVEINGNDDTLEKINKSIDSMINILQSKIGFSPKKVSYSQFQITKSKQIVLFGYDISNRLHIYNGICYILGNDCKVRPAKANEIESIVASKIYARFGKSKDKLVEDISSHSSKIKNCLSSYAKAYKIDNNMRYFRDFEIQFLNAQMIPNEIKEIIADHKNGSQNGLLTVIGDYDKLAGGRYKDSYFRVSAPTYVLPDNKLEIELIDIKQDSIVIVPGGGANLIRKGSRLCAAIPCIIITITTDALEPEVIIAYLKSSFLQWYLCKVFTFDDIFDFFIKTAGKNLPIASFFVEEKNEVLEDSIKKIIELEREFLQHFHDFTINKTLEETCEYLNNHNSICDSIFRSIDSVILSNLEFDKESIEDIYNCLKDLSIYDFKALEYIDTMYN